MKRISSIFIAGASSDVGNVLIRDLDLSFQGREEKVLVYAHYANNGERIEILKKETSNIEIVPWKADFRNVSEVDNKAAEMGVVPDAFVYLAAEKFEHLRLKNLNWENIKREMDVEVGAFAVLCKAFLPVMGKRHYGKVVMMLTEYTLGVPPKFMSHYITSKYAALGFMKAMASEYGEKGVSINAISPTMMETQFLDNIDPRIIAINAEKNVMKRNVSVSEVVKAIEFLLSEGSDYISGINLNVTGGNQA